MWYLILAFPGFKNSGEILDKLKAAYSITFDLLILELMFLFFKNTVKILKSGIHFTNFVNLNKLSVSKQQQLKLPVYNYWRDANNYKQEKNTPVL